VTRPPRTVRNGRRTGWHHVPMTAARGVGGVSGAADQPDDGLTDLAARLRLVVGRLHRRIRIDGRESIPPLQLSALVTIEQHGPLRLSELARREAVTAPTMSRVLAALGENGLVVRTPDPQDARGVLVTLSAEGARRLDAVRRHRTALIARRLARLDTGQRALLHAALPALEALLVDDDP
jgi:DNA-binding MarR family transcriptional regulator